MTMLRKAAVVLTLVLALCRTTGAEDALKPGGAIPMRETKMENVDGRMLSIGEIAGEKGTLVIFACNHCPFVKAWEKRMTSIGNDSMKKGIGVIVINANDIAAYPADDMAHMKEQAKAAGFEFPYVMDATSDVARAFGAGRTPEAFLFDATARLIYHGAIDDNAYQEEASKLACQVRADRVLMRRRAAAALAVLKADSRVDPGRIAAIGDCFGGGCVLELARSGADG